MPQTEFYTTIAPNTPSFHSLEPFASNLRCLDRDDAHAERGGGEVDSLASRDRAGLGDGSVRRRRGVGSRLRASEKLQRPGGRDVVERQLEGEILARSCGVGDLVNNGV